MFVKNNSERGQAIVYLVVGMVVFLGFVALAIDGGMALADRRHAQNGADSSSLAGGANAALVLEQRGVDYDNWHCPSTDVNAAIAYAIDAAETRASANGFSIDGDPSDHNGVTAECGHTDYAWYGDKGDVYIDVTVDISATTQANFLQLLFPKALHSEVDAITRIRPRQPIAFGNAIVALNPGSCTGHNYGGIMYGNGEIEVHGGGVFSNGCLRDDGTPNVQIFDGAPLGNELLTDPDHWVPDPEQVDYQIPDSAYDVPTPNCTGHWVDDLEKMPTVLDDGLYCINNDLRINAGDVISSTGGVTIYVPYGSVTINGTPSVKLAAPDPEDTTTPGIPGVLLYLPPSNPHPVKLNGTEDSIFKGLILAPRSEITLNGTGGNSYVGQVVGWNVEIGGTADFYLLYDGGEVFNTPTAIELAK